MLDSGNSSTLSRDIENLNLVFTFQAHPIVGSGFGHEYLEVIPAVDLGHIFTVFRYMPHNSVLWLLGAAGLIGFTVYWLFMVVGMYLSVRTYRHATGSLERVTALTAATVIISHGLQAYGDMALQSWMASILLAVFLGMVAVLAVKTGAWRSGPVPEGESSK